nr:PREDICTED: sperm-associated antigen 5 [Anolis carolinensis]|eukprot:XP_008118649.2 PREDICTED: sperm-associated antigen 5 [Anolis carolinensis]
MLAVTTEVGETPKKEGVASFLAKDEDPGAILSSDGGPNSTEGGASTSVLLTRGERSGATTSALAWVSTPTISDTGVSTRTCCPREDPIVASLGCECHGAWTSPLSLLDGSPEGFALDFRPATCRNATANPKVWTTPPNLPSARQNMTVGTTITPVCVASATTWTSPPALVGVAVNTSPAEKAATKDNVAETDSLLWRCPRDQWGSLSRSELEVRLESTLIILEALSHQVGAFQDRRAWGTAPSEQRDASSQTPFSDPTEEERACHEMHQALLRRNKALRRNRESERELSQRMAGAVSQMKAWMSYSGQLLDTVDASYLRVQEDRKSLALQQKQLSELLLKCREKLQRSDQKQAEMKSEMEKALQIKQAADQALEAVRSHAALRIEGLTLSFDSQKRFHSLLQEANECKAGLLLESKKNTEEMDRRTTTLRQSWIQMQKDYKTLTNLAARCHSDREKMTTEVAAAREELAQHREVCRELEERTAELAEALGRISELTQANASLETDLALALQRADVAEREKEEACEENRRLSEALVAEQDTTRALREAVERLSVEKEAAQRERESANREAREAAECREFIEEENQIMRRQQAETEAGLKSALATLREQGVQMEDLKGAHRTLQDERDALRAEVVAAKAEACSAGAALEAVSKSLAEMKGVYLQVLEMADLLETPTNVVPASHRLGSSFVDSVLQAAAGKDSRTPGLLSESTAFAKAIPVQSPTPSEIQEDFSCCVRDFQVAAAQIRRLISTRNEEIQDLKAEILRLKQGLEDAAKSLREEKEAAAANADKMNKALHLRLQNEKELQAVMRMQEKRFLQLNDQSWEVATLREEVSQLKGALQKAERESAALWEELGRTKAPSDGDAVREKIWLRGEVEKLREMLLRKDDERKEILSQSLCQVRTLEAQLFQAKQTQRKHEQTQAEIKAALSASPPDVFQACRLLEPNH